VGAGAKEFAIKEGFPLETLLTPESVAAWEKARPKGTPAPATPAAPKPGRGGPMEDHDTVTVLALDQKGLLGGVCSTRPVNHVVRDALQRASARRSRGSAVGRVGPLFGGCSPRPGGCRRGFTRSTQQPTVR
jgi:hypothetical protein